MKDARGLDVTSNDAAAAAAADDFAARLLRLDQGVEAILEAVKHWPATPILQLYAAAFWLYGQTEGARENAATHLRTCDALAMNPREHALHGALARWHANDNLHALAAMEAITAEWPRDLCTAKLAEFIYYVLGQEYMGARFRAHMNRLHPMHADDPDFLAMAAFAHELCDDYPAAETAAVIACASPALAGRARRRTARSCHADDDVDRRQRCPRRPVPPDLSAQPAGRRPARRCDGVFRAHHRRQSAHAARPDACRLIADAALILARARRG
jgi:hypothetical protein